MAATGKRAYVSWITTCETLTSECCGGRFRGTVSSVAPAAVFPCKCLLEFCCRVFDAAVAFVAPAPAQG